MLGTRNAPLSAVLREEGRSTTVGRGARRLRRSLVAAQVAFTFVLLIGAGLLSASLRKVLQVDPGFNPDNVLTASVQLPATRYANDPAIVNFVDEAVRRIRAVPGVTAAGATDRIPFGNSQNDSVILAEGYQMQPGESLISPQYVNTSPGYFEAMGARLRSGRFFDERDSAKALQVIMVDRRLAQRFWPGQDPVGRRMYQPTDLNDFTAVSEKTVFRTVVGVIEDMKLNDMTGAGEDVGAYYIPVAQDSGHRFTFAVKTSVPPETVVGGVRAADRRARQGAAGVRRADHEPAGGRRLGRPAHARPSLDGLRHHGAGALRHRHLRRARLPGPAAAQGDRHPHGAWQHHAGDLQHGAARGRRPRGHRPRYRARRRLRACARRWTRSSTACAPRIRWWSAWSASC